MASITKKGFGEKKPEIGTTRIPIVKIVAVSVLNSRCSTLRVSRDPATKSSNEPRIFDHIAPPRIVVFDPLESNEQRTRMNI